MGQHFAQWRWAGQWVRCRPLLGWPIKGVSVFPLPVSDAQGGDAGYKPADGYWVQKWFPIETGCIKIDYQTKDGISLGGRDTADSEFRFDRSQPELDKPQQRWPLPATRFRTGWGFQVVRSERRRVRIRVRMRSFAWRACVTILRQRTTSADVVLRFDQLERTMAERAVRHS